MRDALSVDVLVNPMRLVVRCDQDLPVLIRTGTPASRRIDRLSIFPSWILSGWRT